MPLGRVHPIDHAAASVTPEIAEELLVVLSRIRRATRRRAGRPSAIASLTGAQIELVHLLRNRSDLSINEAATALSLAPNTVSTLVGQLSASGAVRRVTDPSDRRVARLALSEEFAQLVAAWRDRRVVTIASAIEHLDDGTSDVLPRAVAALGALARELEEGDAP